MKIAIIMTVHNRKEKTISCLNILCKNIPQSNIYLTNDGCTDGTEEAIKIQFPSINIINGDGTLFWNRGMIAAWKEACKNNYDFYIWLNDDTIVTSTFITDLIKCSEEENHHSIICGATVDPIDHSRITYGGYTKNIKILPISKEKQYCSFASGNIVLIPQYVVNKIGLLDPAFRHALGDFDYEGRARQNGIKIVQAPNYLGFCARHSTIPSWRDKNIPLNKRLKKLYSPLGRNPFEMFLFDKRHHSIIIAFFHFFTLHLRCFFPSLWKLINRYNEKE